MPPDFEWSEHTCTTLETLWRAGVPVKLIADNMGITRGMVIGKANRMGYGEHAASTQKLKREKQRNAKARG